MQFCVPKNPEKMQICVPKNFRQFHIVDFEQKDTPAINTRGNRKKSSKNKKIFSPLLFI